MALREVSAHELDLAQASYSRCLEAPNFFRAFYDRFLASDPAIPPYFADTSFERQDRLLQHGISLLLIYAKRPNPALLERITERHGPGDLKIPARLYPLFLQGFLATVAEFDPGYSAEVEAAWRSALAPGFAIVSGGAR